MSTSKKKKNSSSAVDDRQAGDSPRKIDLDATLDNINAAIAELGTGNISRGGAKGIKETKEAQASTLGKPVILGIEAIGSGTIRLTWDVVANAGRYYVQSSTESDFSYWSASFEVPAPVTTATINNLMPGTTYVVRIMAKPAADDPFFTDSPYSDLRSATTWNAADDTADLLQSMAGELHAVLDHFSTQLPQLESTMLTPADRRRLLGSGVRRYGFIEKVFEVSGEYPQFWPDFAVDRKKMEALVREIDVLRNLLIWFRSGSRVIQDLLLLAGTDAFRMANFYYVEARNAAQRGVPDGVKVFQMLQLFWHRRRRPTDETRRKGQGMNIMEEEED